MTLMKYLQEFITVFATCLLPSVLSFAAEAQPDWARMIECRAGFKEYTSFVLGDFQNEQFKVKIGVKEVQQGNPFLNEYELSKPIEVYDYSTRRIVFNSSGIMAVLDEKNPLQLAKKLGLEFTLNAGDKVLATKTVSETKPEIIGAMKVWQKISKDLSTVSSHPDKTLLGCTYKPMMEE